jgi:hypothetical protein
MPRIAAKDVPILHHAIETIAVMDFKNLNLAMAQNYETLDDHTKIRAGIDFGLKQIAMNQTRHLWNEYTCGGKSTLAIVDLGIQTD